MVAHSAERLGFFDLSLSLAAMCEYNVRTVKRAESRIADKIRFSFQPPCFKIEPAFVLLKAQRLKCLDALTAMTWFFLLSRFDNKNAIT